ncbi:hypothetical protein L5515_009566 [Caenorhabditis briggsae]|uniref:Uncharacterized protein n=1 Tax=Caenorhabditis briggsae TaxID=6238 RepID=A0AAE9F3U2_CAEBR|nr:hypothetical protein L5515_009566 [Caenorhabditis briggsae]
MVPIILMHIPVTILYTCSLLDIIFRLPVESTIALFPALDPFPTIFIVKSYRNTILGTDSSISSSAVANPSLERPHWL